MTIPPILTMSSGTAGLSHSLRDWSAVLLSRADLPDPPAPYNTNGFWLGPVIYS